MIRLTILVAVAALGGLAACGVDGEPIQPEGGVPVSLSSSGGSAPAVLAGAP